MKKNLGFTLIELILVLVIVGIMAVFSTFGLMDVMNSYIQNKQYVESSLKLNVAINRIFREFKEMHGVSKYSSSSIQYKRDGTDYAISLVGSDLKLSLNSTYPDENSGYIILDKVGSFDLSLLKSDDSPWQVGDGISHLSRILVSINLNTTPPIGVKFSVNPWFNDTYNGPGK